MGRPRAGKGDAASSGFSNLGERVTLVFLLVATLALGYVRFRVLPERAGPEPRPFDLRNPMLRAETGQCVEVETTTRPGEVVCFRVRDEGLVLRPNRGPDRLGYDRDLKRAAPYLVCGLRTPPQGQGCGAESVGREQIERFELNAFGMPASLETEVVSIRPRWVQRGGRYHFTYEVVLSTYGQGGSTWQVYLSPDMPVTGVLFRVFTTPRGDTEWVVFRAAEGCR